MAREAKKDDKKPRTGLNNGDAIARALSGLKHEDIVKVAKANRLYDGKYDKHDGKLNNGRFRMLLGNSLRAKVKAKQPVKIKGLVIERLNQRI